MDNRDRRLLVHAVLKGLCLPVRLLTPSISSSELQLIAGPVFAFTKSTEVVEVLLQHGVSPNTVSKRGWTRWHAAASCDNISEILLLARFGGDPNVRDANGSTPLELAETTESIRAIHALISVGADVNARSVDGNTALHWAASNGRLPCVHALLECNASPHLRNNRGETPLLLVPGLRHECRVNGSKIAELLISQGADIHARDNGGRQTIHNAARQGYDELLLTLLQHGADPHARSFCGVTPRQFATHASTIQLLDLILEST